MLVDSGDMQHSSSLARDVAQLLSGADNPRASVVQLLAEVAASLVQVAERRGDEEEARLRCVARDLELFAHQFHDEGDQPLTLREQIELLRRRAVRKALAATKHNVSRAARSLGVGRNLIYDVLERSKKRP